jgi:peptidoglycan/xylan/chitin deacetylase (PgdA/CDA1 family)
MNFDTIENLKKAGNEIGSRGLTNCDQTTLNEPSLIDSAFRSKQTLEQKNLGPVKTFAYPFGAYNKTTQSIYSSQYLYIRTNDSGYNDRYFDETDIRSMAVSSDTTDTQYKSWLDYANLHHLWLVIVYHHINESGQYNVTKTQLDRQLNMVTESGLTVLPVSEAAGQIRP